MLLQNLIVACCLLLSFISLSESFIRVQCLRHAQRNSLLAAKRFGWLNRNKESNVDSNKNDDDDDFSPVTKKFAQERAVTAMPKPFPAAVAAKSKFNQDHKIVQRALGPLERKPLSELTVGEKLRGRIITITNFGMFVDVGSSTDGLVHIKDASSTYFVKDLNTRFEAGKDLDVWVKFVDVELKKLGLQLFPVIPSLETKYDWKDLEVGMQVKGRVVKFAEFGTFFDVGGPATAFMPRFRMKSNRKQRKLMPWELLALNDDLECYVYKISPSMRRIELTAYPPDSWERMFLEKTRQPEEDDEDEDEDIATMSYSNKEALKRNLAVSTQDSDDEESYEDDEDEDDNDDDDDDEEEEYVDTDDDEGEVLSAEEVYRLTGRKLVMDDFAEEDAKQKASENKNQVTNRGEAEDKGKEDEDEEVLEDEEDELDTDELFVLLSHGRSFVTFSDVKQWTYIQLLLQQGDLQTYEVKNMFIEAGAQRGRLDEDGFVRFVEIFVNRLGLEADFDDRYEEVDEDDEDEEEDVGEDDDEEEEEQQESISVSLEQNSESDEQEELIGMFVASPNRSVGKLGGDTRAFEELYEEASRNAKAKESNCEEIEDEEDEDEEDEEYESESHAELTREVFDSLAGTKGYVSVKDLMNWDFVLNAIGEGLMTEEELKERVTDLSPKVDGKKAKGLDVEGFDSFLDEMMVLFEEVDADEEDVVEEQDKVINPNVASRGVGKPADIRKDGDNSGAKNKEAKGPSRRR